MFLILTLLVVLCLAYANGANDVSKGIATAILVGIASRFGLPVSTTHVASGAIIGVGLKKGERAVRWKTVLDMLLAWIITLPVSAVIAGLSYLVLNRVFIS